MRFSIGTRLAILLASSGISLAGASAMLSVESRSHTVLIVDDNAKAVIPTEKRGELEEIKIDPYSGGLDYDLSPPCIYDPVMSPKEYGLSIYHGNKRKRSNRLRFSHNAKLKRRCRT